MNTMNRTMSIKEAVLQALADEISIPPGMAKEARDRFASIARWMDRDGSTLAAADAHLHPQGSYLLGTVIRPVGDRDEYDVDMVCTLRALPITEKSQADVKADVGYEVRGYAEAHGMREPVEGRRCWRIDYAKSARFHCDILPSVPRSPGPGVLAVEPGALSSHLLAAGRTVIGITDREHPDYDRRSPAWNMGNPKGYELWFKNRQRQVLEERLRTRRTRDGVRATVEELPLQDVSTPLQDAIKLLKRHRDVMFNGDPHKPISIIIATLAAHAYGGQETISDTLHAVLPRMDSFIENRGGAPWVENPACPDENFADRWVATSKKAANFHAWLLQARRDFGDYILMSDALSLPDGLRTRMTETTVGKVLPRLGLTTPALAAPALPRLVADEEARYVLIEGRPTKPWLP